jgi:hypothetical protein
LAVVGAMIKAVARAVAMAVAVMPAVAVAVREGVVAELILMVNWLYRIMSVAMLNYEWCLTLRSVLGTSGVWPK